MEMETEVQTTQNVHKVFRSTVKVQKQHDTHYTNKMEKSEFNFHNLSFTLDHFLQVLRNCEKSTGIRFVCRTNKFFCSNGLHYVRQCYVRGRYQQSHTRSYREWQKPEGDKKEREREKKRLE